LQEKKWRGHCVNLYLGKCGDVQQSRKIKCFARAVEAEAIAERGEAEDPFGSLSQVCAVLGTQWGDEGKGKLVDVLAQRYDIVARCQVFTPIFSC
jgi:hypothetical protein